MPVTNKATNKNKHIKWLLLPKTFDKAKVFGIAISYIMNCTLSWLVTTCLSTYSQTIKFTMVNRKCVICKATKQVYIWPTDINIRNKWDVFIAKNMPQINVKKSHGICYLHFKRPDDFSNYEVWEDNISKGIPTT